MNKKIMAAALQAQKKELNEYHIYNKLAKICKDSHNAEILRKVGEAEKHHALFWQKLTGKEVKPSRFAIFKNILTARILGLTFTLKQMEKNEGTASLNYLELSKEIPEVAQFSKDEAEHEKELLNMLDEERLRYAGSVVLGLNDALVELTGALAGFTLALGNTKLITLAGLITGISASFSMAASEYLSCKADNDPKALKSAFYTGFAYIITVALLILPFLLISQKFIALAITLAAAVFIIFIFNYYLAVAKDLNFKKRFAEMAFISLGVAALSFGVGYILQKVLGVEI
ncbi:MAG: VIT1/CCC1 transporter family protein [Treponema sp.]|nr:VIT1/CCC1 transporter family protein [Treponema sp.]MCL2238228.1 VIT1/CCC1 transporter family protein [Treponema sp.]